MKNHEGIFRLTGSTANTQALQQQIEKGEKIKLNQQPINDLASLLKVPQFCSVLHSQLFFVSLPDTLLPEQYYETYKQVSKETDLAKKKQLTKELFKGLPIYNKVCALPIPASHLRQNMLVDLFFFLRDISTNSQNNKMTPENLAVCWAPTLIIPKSISSSSQLLWDSHTVTQYFGKYNGFKMLTLGRLDNRKL